VILTDQNFPAALPSLDGKCPAIIRVEGGLLSELGDFFYSLLKDFTLPEGSVLMIGSLSHLMEEGLVGYAKGLGTEIRRFSKLFCFTVHVIPFIPPPYCGTNDPDLISNMVHITTWLEKVQRWNIGAYHKLVREYVIAGGPPDDRQVQKTQRQKMPASYELFGEFVMMCHPVAGLGGALPLMCARNEQILINSLLTELGSVFKWDLDPNPLSMRELGGNVARGPCKAVPRTDAVIIGGSNAGRLHDAFSDIGKVVESMDSPGWTISKAAVDALLPILAENLGKLPESVPVILYCLDNSAFKAMNSKGDLVSFTRLKKDQQFHVIGDLVVTPYTLLSATLAELDRVIAACGNRRIFILAILPRYFLKPCCDDITHCANVCRHDETAVEAGKKLLRDLEALNEQLADRYNGRNTQFIFSGDLLTGKNRSSMGDLVDSLFECWRSDPVHGDKSAYIKLAMGLMDFLEPKPDSRHRKRLRTASPPPPPPDSPPPPSSGYRGRDNRYDDRQQGGYRSRSHSAFSSYPGDSRRASGSGGASRF
jgi:hypothetical protein